LFRAGVAIGKNSQRFSREVARRRAPVEQGDAKLSEIDAAIEVRWLGQAFALRYARRFRAAGLPQKGGPAARQCSSLVLRRDYQSCCFSLN